IGGAGAAVVIVISFVHEIDGLGAQVHPQALSVHGKDAFVDVAGGRQDFDLVADTTEEGVVYQVARIEVGGKDNQLLEGHFELLSVGGGEIIMTAFQGQNPAVEQLLGADQLTAEVVDQKHTTISLCVEGRLGKIRLGGEAQGQHGQVQLPPRDDHGAA